MIINKFTQTEQQIINNHSDIEMKRYWIKHFETIHKIKESEEYKEFINHNRK